MPENHMLIPHCIGIAIMAPLGILTVFWLMLS
jgi:hypothetical protein